MWPVGLLISSKYFMFIKLKVLFFPPVCSVGVFVPSALAAFPEELLHCPKAWAKAKYFNIYSYTLMPRGGHFAAFEEPQLLADDIFKFVRKVEKC